MERKLPDVGLILDAASEIIVAEGFERVTLERVALRSEVSPETITELFGSFEDVLVCLLNREFAAMYASIIDQVERDPRGGLLSRMYLYMLSRVYERPLARMLYTIDPRALNTMMRSAHSLGFLPDVGVRADLIETLQRVGMVRRDADAPAVSHLITTFSAGLALTAPHEDLDLVVRGFCDLLGKAVDTDAVDTTAGKETFYAWATSLTGQE